MLQHPLHQEVIVRMHKHQVASITQKVNVRPLVFPHFNSTFYGVVQMKFDLDIHCLRETREGGERKGK